MKKVAILTFMQTNYGAILQAYSTLRFLHDHGADAELIDFTTPSHLKNYKVFQDMGCKNILKRMLIYLCTIPKYIQFKQRFKRTLEFKQKHFRCTRRYASVEELMLHPPQDDIFITGSDQVFNPKREYIPVYYLDFVREPAKRVAFAPSFGIAKFDDLKEMGVANYLRKFQQLSCREQEGADFMQTLLTTDIPVVLDPVFLLDKSVWRTLAKNPHVNKEYIFVYDLGGGNNLINVAKKLSERENLPIYCLSCNRLALYNVDKIFFNSGPSEFLGWIENASYVVTDSFHGSCFSIIFGKKFISYIANKETSSRLVNLLSTFNVEQNMIFGTEILPDDCKVVSDFQNFPLVLKSRTFLKNIIV